MKRSSILFYTLLITYVFGCGQKKEGDKRTDSGVQSSSSKKETTEKENTNGDGDGLYAFDAVPTPEEIRIGDEYMDEIGYGVLKNAYAILQQTKNDIITRKPLVQQLGLPAGALIIEQQVLSYPNRSIILWMKNPRVGFVAVDEVYTCPQSMMGTGYFYGETRVSLINTKTYSIINTLEVIEPAFEGYETDACTIPFSIANPKYKSSFTKLNYHAVGGDSIKDGKAQLLYFEDFTGDGKKQEFALFNQIDCGNCFSTLFGYNDKSDSVVNYPVVLEHTDLNSPGKKPEEILTYYPETMFAYRPKNGRYIFEVDTRARGGRQCNYAVSFNAEKNRFEGTRKCLPANEDDL